MLNLNLNWVSEAIKYLNQWYPVVKSNFEETQNAYNSHILGTADKHSAENVTYTGNVSGATNAKEGLDLLSSRVDTIITTPAEGVSAQEIIDARGGEATLGAKIISIEDTVTEHFTQSAKRIKGYGLAADTTALQSLLDEGGDIYISGRFDIDTPLQVSIDNTRVVCSADIDIRHNVYNQNCVEVTGNNCDVFGLKITSPETWDGENIPWTYAVVYVTGNNSTVRGSYLINVPRVGIGIHGGSKQNIYGNRIFGNYPSESWTGVETVHFGICYSSYVPGEEDINIHHNFVETCVQGVYEGEFSSGRIHGLNISNNIFNNCLNHGIYANGGYGNVINDNNFNQCQTGIASYAQYANIQGNNIYTDGTDGNNDIVGISMREPIGTICKGNVIKGIGLTNSTIIDLANLLLDPSETNTRIKDNIIEGNIIDISSGKVIAINVGKVAMTEIMENNSIHDNTVISPCRRYKGLIQTEMKAGYYGKNNNIKDNKITIIADSDGSSVESYGVLNNNQIGGRVQNNDVIYAYNAESTQTVMGVRNVNSQKVLTKCNKVMCTNEYGANLTIQAIRDDATCNNNIYEDNIIDIDTMNAQVETVSVTAGATAAGTLVVTITAAGMTNSPKAINVAVTTDDDTAAEVAAKVRDTLGLDTDVSDFFTVSGTDANIVLTANEIAANDSTMDIALTDADSTGVTFGSSTDTTADTICQPLILSGTGFVTKNNILSTDPMSGTVTFGTSENYVTVTNKNITGSSKVTISPSTKAAALLLKNSGIYITYISDTSFTLHTADQSTPSSTAVFYYTIQ